MTKSIEERLRDAQQAITLIIAGLNAEPDNVGLTSEDLADAMASVAGRAHDDLYWVQKALTGAMMNRPAPTDEEREDGDRRRETAAS